LEDPIGHQGTATLIDQVLIDAVRATLFAPR